MTAFLASKTVLVTGAAGFIGSHLCEQLLQSGAQVVGVDNFLTGRDQNIAALNNNPRFQFIQADVIQPVSAYLPAEIKPDVVLHFASPASPPRYQAHPVETYLVNSLATHYLVQYLKDSAPQARLVFASTSEVYGDPQVHPQTEEYWGNVNPNGVRSCYDEAKRLGESICGVHYRDFGVDVRIVRIFNTFGPRMDPTDGRIIPQFVTEALRGEKLSIFGDGSQTRSYCYVADLVRGILELASHAELAGATVNLGNPEEYTVLDTARIIYELVTGQPATDANFAFKPLPKDDPTRRRPDITRAQELLAWSPTTSFKEGLQPTVEYFRQA